MQQALKEKDLEADSEEIWEPLQAYYRRLSNAMAKAEGWWLYCKCMDFQLTRRVTGGKKKTKKTKSSAPTGDDEERLDDNGEEPQPRPPKSALKRRPKPKPKGRPTSSPRRPRSSSQEDQNEGSEMSDADIGDKMTETKTPKRPKHAGDTSSEAPSPQKRSLKRREREPNDAHDESELAESLMTYESQGDTLPSRKRSKQN